ncbi:hypothetical protein C2845_PM07G06030 [Panicum miliaceum]|uniref:Serpin domain-containing protein n=1 Tax=Panicum miliaceum TaxID=4540 RepID=A0A3L6SMX4_PANMI|nr:hypothetical protein C2845_PM07G06030 [Panicum miliaceum]
MSSLRRRDGRPERTHPCAPAFAQPPDDPFPWNTPAFANPFGGPCLSSNVPWGPPGEVPFGGFGGGAAAPNGGRGEPGVFFPDGGRPAPMDMVVSSDCDADGRASCLPLARQLDELRRAAATALVGALRDLPQTSFACGVWVDRNRVLVPEFADTAASRYAAVAESADFFSEPEQARRRVNAFVSEATRGLIADVLPPGSVDSSTVLVLANALYFKGTWARPFNPSRTFAAPFHLPGGDTARAPFMTANLFKEQMVAVFPGFRALKLPYKNGGGARQAAFYMLLLLPDGEALKIGDLYDKAVSTPGFIRKHTPADEVPVGRFMVPKFKFTFEFEASEDVQKLGVTRAFEGGDFSGIVAGGNGLSISGVYHKATREVDELGTVAAAAMAVGIQECERAPRPPVDFVADRPFLFAIVEERSGVVLFLGHW